MEFSRPGLFGVLVQPLAARAVREPELDPRWVLAAAARAWRGSREEADGGAGPPSSFASKLETQPCPQDVHGPEATLRGRFRGSGPAALGL